MEVPGPASLVFIILSVSGITNAARLFAAEHGTQVRLPCDENVETTDELSGLSTFDAVWTDPRGVTLADDGDQSGAELRGEPWVDAFSGDLSLAAVDFADAGEYSCSARYADGEALTEPRVSKHVLQGTHSSSFPDQSSSTTCASTYRKKTAPPSRDRAPTSATMTRTTACQTTCSTASRS